MIKTAGANVSPREVEAVLADAAGLRAHVVGLDDADRGQRVAAAIVSDEPVDLDALKVAAARAAVVLQGAEDLPRARRGRGTDAVERKARPAGPEGALRWTLSRRPSRRSSAIAPSIPPTWPHWSTTRTSISYRELDERSRALAARLVAAGVGKRSRVGVLMPNGIDWATVAYAALRVGAVLVPLSTLLKPPELEAQLRGASVAAPRHRAELPRPGLRRRARLARARTARSSARPGCGIRASRRCATSGPRTPSPPRPRRRALVEALEAAVRPADDLAILFTSGQPRRARRASCTPTATRCARSRAVSTRAASAAASGSTSRCRSSGWAASAEGC